jgi:Domain of unknown function (DUF4276)
VTFVRFGLIVTGEGEERFLPELFKLFHRLPSRHQCTFQVIRRIGQRSQRNERNRLLMVGSGKLLPDRDMDEIGLPARFYLQKHGEHAHVLLIDDLEWDRREGHREHFERYGQAFDHALMTPESRRRAAVFFLVTMLEAYYFGDPDILCAELGIVELPAELRDVDVETIRHPKNELKRLRPGFDEIVDGERLVRRLEVANLLANPERCAALRTLFAWCARALGIPWGSGTGFLDGALCAITRSQLAG